MELGTFGAVIKFAIDLESSAQQFYQNGCENVKDIEMITIFEKLSKRCLHRIGTLERIRRENVTEMILEPIKDLDSDTYKLVIDDPDWYDRNALVKTSLEIENTRKKFFEDASVKIEFLIEAADAFERLSDENDDNLDIFAQEYK